jgi:hypothetical protein
MLSTRTSSHARIFAIFALFSIILPHANSQEPAGLHVEGYAWPLSVIPGESVGLHFSSTAPNVQFEIVRIGAENKPMKLQATDKSSSYSAPAKPHAIPEKASSEGCGWPASTQISIPPDWPSGYYEVRMSATDNGGKYTHRGRRTASSTCYFVVRSANPGLNSKILIQLATNTYNAYNNWGGFSLYAYNGTAGNQGSKVSFLRPPSSQFSNWEHPFVTWAEKNGFQLDYAINEDLEFHPEILDKYKLVLSVGHDEYWSAGMRDNLEKYIAEGGNVAFFSGNSICWQVRPENDGTALTSWKQNAGSDPIFKTGEFQTLSSLWSHHLINRPENKLTGVGFLFGGYHRSHGHFMNGSGGYTIHRPKHWIFEGTQLLQGDLLGAKDTIVGYECDGCEMQLGTDGLPAPTGNDGTPKNFEILGTSPAQWHADDAWWYERFEHGRLGAAVLGTYTSAKGGTVITSGSTDWAHGLRGEDPKVMKITKNILERLGK